MKHKHSFGTIRIAPSKGVTGLPKVGELVVEDALGLVVKVETKRGAEVMVRIPHGAFKFYSEVIGGTLEAPAAKKPRKRKKLTAAAKKRLAKKAAAAEDAEGAEETPRKTKKSKAARLALKKAHLLKKKRLAKKGKVGKKGKHRKGKKSLKIANLLEGTRKL